MGVYTGPVRFVWLGPVARCQRYVHAGRKLLAEVMACKARGGIDSLARVVRLADGTVIEAIDDGPDQIVRVSASATTDQASDLFQLFMETGYLDLRPIYPIGEGPKPAAKLYYGQPQQALLTERPPFLDWVRFARTDQQQLTLVGGETREYTAGMDSLAISSTWLPDDAQLPESERRPNPDGTSDKRYWLYPSWYGYHPTNRSGKLKLLLQALHGRRDLIDPAWALGALRGRDTLQNSLGIYTYESGDHYALIQVRVSGGFAELWAMPLKYRKDIRWAIERIKPDDALLEAWWLSTLAETNAAPAVMVAALGPVSGEPFAYGWKFNRRGDRISIVTTERVYSANSNRILHYTGRRYEIHLFEWETEARTAAARYGLEALMLVKEDDKHYTPRTNGDLLWYPSIDPSGASKLKCFYWEDWPGQYANGPTVLCSDVPIYCWYDESDQLQIVRFFCEKAVAVDAQWGWLVGCGQQHSETFELYRGSDRYNAGFYLDGAIEKLYGDQSGSWIHQETLGIETHAGVHSCYAGFSYLDCNGAFYTPPPTDCGLSQPPYIGWNYHHIMGVGWYRLDQYVEQSSSKTLLIIPFGAVESIYLGSLESKVQDHVDRIEHFDVIASVIGWPVRHQPQGGIIVDGQQQYTSVYQHLLFKLLSQHAHVIAADQVIESGKSANLGWNAGWTDYGAPGAFPSDFTNLLSPVLYGPDAWPFHRPMSVYESDAGLITYEKADPVSNVMVFAANDQNLPPAESFSLFVGGA